MAALTADKHVTWVGKTPTKIGVPAIGADTFYKGALVYADATNGKAQVVPASGDYFIGICAKQVVAAAADAKVEIYVDGTWVMFWNTPVQGDVGGPLVQDISATQTDNISDCIGSATLATGDIRIGIIKAVGTYEGATGGLVQLTVGAGTTYDATGVTFA